MPFTPRNYTPRFLENAKSSGDPITPEAKYEIRIVRADVAEGETYWRVIGVHHLLPEENFSNHNAFLEALDEQGNRIKNPIPFAGWTWEGRRPNERADPTPLDKGDNEAAGNISVGSNQTVSIWLKGLSRDANDKSDRVENLHTRHADEILSDGRKLNTIGHHSFYIVFQRTRKGASASITDGLIMGRVENGQGKRVRLLQNGQPVAEQALDNNLTFRLASLPAGVYRLEVVGTSLAQDNLTINASNKTITLNLTLPVSPPPTTTTTPVPPPPPPTTTPTPVPPPTPPPPATKIINHYLLFGPSGSRGRQTNLLLATSYILTFSPTVGFSVAEAKQARQVTIIGEGISPADQQAIQGTGAQVEVLAGDPYAIETKLTERIRAGRAFGG